MPQLRISFQKIDVIDDGDRATDGKGEFNYHFSVDSDMVVSEESRQGVKASNGDTIRLNGEIIKTVPDTGLITLRGDVIELDNNALNTDGGHDKASFQTTFRQSNGWGIGPHTHSLQANKMKVKVHYNIERL
jgi:hypothetical protein